MEQSNSSINPNIETFEDSVPLTEANQSPGSKEFDKVMTEVTKGKRYAEKTVVGRVVGRDKVVIEESDFYKLASLHCSWKELSTWYGVAETTLRDNFRELYYKAREDTKLKLRQQMIKQALSGDRVLLIWLSKNLMNFADSPQTVYQTEVLPWSDDDVNPKELPADE